MGMKIFGRGAVSEFLGDQLVYRNLEPADARLPCLDEIRQAAGLKAGAIPRKSEPEYARAIVQLLRQARKLDAPGRKIERLAFIGDTRMNDGQAFANLCAAGGWPGLAFIGSENSASPEVKVEPAGNGISLYLANRWAALEDFDRFCAGQGVPLDGAAAVVVDLDKTAIGARGRNAQTIDQARVKAVYQTVAGLLGPGFDPAALRQAYD